MCSSNPIVRTSRWLLQNLDGRRDTELCTGADPRPVSQKAVQAVVHVLLTALALVETVVSIAACTRRTVPARHQSVALANLVSANGVMVGSASASL